MLIRPCLWWMDPAGIFPYSACSHISASPHRLNFPFYHFFFHFLFFFFFFVNKNKQKDEPPEITYCVVNQNGMMHLQTLSPAQPMPEESELDAKFTELLVIVFLVIFFIFSRLRNVFGWLFPGMDFIGSSFSSFDDRWYFFSSSFTCAVALRICVAVVYTPMLSRIFIQRWCDDDICPTFFRRV